MAKQWQNNAIVGARWSMLRELLTDLVRWPTSIMINLVSRLIVDIIAHPIVDIIAAPLPPIAAIIVSPALHCIALHCQAIVSPARWFGHCVAVVLVIVFGNGGAIPC